MPTETLNFLVAEDHSFQRKSLVRMLKLLGAVQVAEAGDGAAALEVLQRAAIDIAIVDLNMPGMDGMELIRHLAELHSPAHIIVSSALDRALLASVETMARAYGVHLLGVIEKPATPDKLRQLIASYGPVAESQRARRAVFSEDEIRAALERREFLPYFQPKARLADGGIDSVEALARWRHPQAGVVAPGAFIDKLEGLGLIDELTWQMLEQSAAAWKAWAAQGMEFRISVNLSLSSLEQPGYADRIIFYLAEQGIGSRHFVFEITESTAMTDLPHCLENLTRLRMKGYGLSIDDFGTGYSSLQQLAQIPFSELKIDRSFVTGACASETTRTMLASSLDLAGRLGLSSVAEGVETRQDWALLKRMGCGYAQGYFMARPQSAADLPGAIARWTETHRALSAAAA
ncbi:EAL domain-containing response regulator [Pseudoduganella aquatica]|uniref:EAL domain-containing protein n=1 Tax=Pseudoduganella aquatica TaxID=2660641 RepID=A0A7X4KNH1_9BURK|nr:EAL domain-containing response regulator [Pseudoduganella aquatica]MYN09223.1 EAL domain-containing protein [Pseudoduganella aquatica]